MSRNIILFIIALTLSTVKNYSQELSSKSYKSGEHLTYQVSYNVSGLLSTIAQVDMRASALKTTKKQYMQLKCTAHTYSKWDGFFKIRDLYESYVNPYNSEPAIYKRDTNENGTIRKEKYIYKGTNVKATYVRGQSGEIKGDFTISPGTKDVVSTLYYIRNLPIEKAKIGDSKDFKIAFDRKTKTIRLSFLGKETINTIFGEKSCYKISVSLKNENLLTGNKNSNIMYITADENKVPVLIKFSIPVGNGQLKLTTAKNLKH